MSAQTGITGVDQQERIYTVTNTAINQLRPWQEEGIGVPVTGALTTKEALKLSGHDWTVEKVRMMTAPKIVYIKDDETGEDARDADGDKIKDVAHSENSDLFGIYNPSQCMTVRVDRDSAGNIVNQSYLGTVGVDYTVVDNADATEFFDGALGEGAACINGVGTLGRFGARIIMVAQMPEMLEVVPGDPIERHILLTNTHDGTGNVEARFITFRAANRAMIHMPGEVVKIRHTKNAKKRLGLAHKVLFENEQFWSRAKRAYAYMAKRDADTIRVREFLEALFPDIPEKDEKGKVVTDEFGDTVMKTSPQAQKARDEIRALYDGDAPGADVAGKTDWGLYNAVTSFVDHDRRLSKTQNKWRISRWEVSVFGPGADLREAAYRYLTKDYDLR